MSTFYQLDFEKPLADLERQIDTLQTRIRRAETPAGAAPPAPAAMAEADGDGVDALDESTDEIPASREQLLGELADLRRDYQSRLAEVYSNLTPMNTVRVAPHPLRPQTRDYIDRICKDFCELHGDRHFGDDPAMVVGFARIGSVKCLIVGHHKGRTTQEKIACHFGCAHPEGYRKALAKMKLAEKFKLPIVCFVDTQGAYPGIGAEQRGQAEAIAVNLREMSRLKTPVVAVVIGEGGSGGALGIAVADRVAMLEHAWYSVISPEGCAAILWKQANEQTNAAAAKALRLTSRDNLELGIIDAIIPEPVGGAHRDPVATAAAIERWVLETIDELRHHNPATLPARRYDRFRKLGAYADVGGGDDRPGSAAD